MCTCLEPEFRPKCVSIQRVECWAGERDIQVLVIPLVLIWCVICSKTVFSQYPSSPSFTPFHLSAGIEILSLTKCLSISCLLFVSNMAMEKPDISSSPNFISDGNLNLFSFFACRRRLSRWQYLPFSDHCHFLLFSQHGIDFISCFALLPTQGQLMVSSLTATPVSFPAQSSSPSCAREESWWSASVTASVFPDLFSLLHKWNGDHPLHSTVSIHTQQCRGQIMESEFLPVGYEIRLDSQW